jgi:hypothetical protein
MDYLDMNEDGNFVLTPAQYAELVACITERAIEQYVLSTKSEPKVRSNPLWDPERKQRKQYTRRDKEVPVEATPSAQA